jgi:GNAT superfamily N-acetyltransferase
LWDLFLKESNTQIRYNAVHERGWSDSYFLSIEGINIGYASIRGQDLTNRNTVFEFYIIPPYRKFSSVFFQYLLIASNARLIECQSNDELLTPMIYEFSNNIRSDVILFSDKNSTNLMLPGTIYRPRNELDKLFKHNHEPEGTHVLGIEGEIIATGGFLLHYNMPFSDLYMEVRKDQRRKGVGSYLVQQIKKNCYLAGRIPAARCNMDNYSSKATLLKAGFKISGYML